MKNLKPLLVTFAVAALAIAVVFRVPKVRMAVIGS